MLAKQRQLLNGTAGLRYAIQSTYTGFANGDGLTAIVLSVCPYTTVMQ